MHLQGEPRKCVNSIVRNASDVAHVLSAPARTQMISAVIWERVYLGQISHGDQNKDWTRCFRQHCWGKRRTNAVQDKKGERRKIYFLSSCDCWLKELTFKAWLVKKYSNVCFCKACCKPLNIDKAKSSHPYDNRTPCTEQQGFFRPYEAYYQLLHCQELWRKLQHRICHWRWLFV